MTLKDRINDDMKAAMKAKDAERLGAIRLLNAAIKQKEVDERVTLDDAAVVGIVDKMLKQRKDSIEAFEKAGRQDLADKETREIAILENYLPAAPSDSDMSAAIEAAITETGANSPKAMGAVIKAAKVRLEGKTVDGKVLSDRVKDRLSKMG